ncbi:HNH endonuclease [Luteibacter jiangsuensis]
MWESEALLHVRRHVREYYREAQRLKCAYCGNQVSSRSAVAAPIEHIVPKSEHPRFMFEPRNLCVVCADCNEYKSNKATTQSELVLAKKRVRYPTKTDAFRVVHPHYDTYEEHIFKSGRIYLPLTPKGSWTIYVCELNRFFIRFGRCDELISDIELVKMQEKFFSES